MLNLQFISTLLYPAGHNASRILFDPRVTYPPGWTAVTALDVESKGDGNTTDYADGLRYPRLERIEGRPDYLTSILRTRK